MSHLADHARAMRALGEALRAEGENGADRQPTSELLCLMGDAHIQAADRLERELREEAQAWAQAARCTIDHGSIKATACPACKAPLAKR